MKPFDNAPQIQATMNKSVNMVLVTAQSDAILGSSYMMLIGVEGQVQSISMNR